MRDIDKYVNDYINTELKEFEFYQVKYRRKMLLEQIEKYKPGKILEIGCGMEPLFCYVKDVAFTVIEPGKIFCENAERLAESEKRNVQIIHGLFENVECNNEEYDMIICSSLLHELENPEEFCRKIADKCTNNTIVHINVPNAMSMHRVLAKECGFIDEVTELSEMNLKMQRHSVFTKESLSDMIEKCGFSLLEINSYFIKPFAHAQMQRLLESHIIEEDVLEGLYNLIKYIPDLGSEIYVNCKLNI